MSRRGRGPALLCGVTFPSNTGYAWDFIETLYARMADRLSAAGVSTFVAYPSIHMAPAPLLHSAAVSVALKTELTSVSDVLAFYRFVRLNNIRVVYLTDRPARSFQYALMRIAGVRLVIVHDHTSGERQGAIGMRRFMKRIRARIPGITADQVIAVSDYVVRRHAAVTMLPRRRIRRVWNGIATEDIANKNSTPTLREMLNISPDQLIVACACRATPVKGVDILFRAFDRLVQEWPGPQQPVLAYIGSGPQIEQLQDLRSGLASCRAIHMLGFLRGAADILRSADAIVVPSLWQDAFPLSVLEMMARGKAVIATRVGGIPEMIVDGESGLLVEPGDIPGLCNALAYLLTHRDIRDQFGESAHRRIKEKFVLSDQIDAMLSSFRDVLVARGR